MKKIGIYISAFDPIHSGHLAFAEDALKYNKLDKLYFLVEPSPKHKQGVKAIEHRVNMTMLATSGNPRFGTIVPKSWASLDEYIKLIQTRLSGYTLSLIIPDSGMKHFFQLPNILSYNFKNTELVVGLEGQTADEVNLRLKLLSETSGLKFKYSWFKTKRSLTKSADIKRKLKEGIRPEEIQKVVYDYIIKQKLYVAISRA